MDTENLHNELLPCVWKQTTGIDCMGCGTQRSVLALLEGDLANSIVFFPALMPMIFMFAILTGHLIFKFRHGATLLKWWFIGTAGITLINWLGKAIWPLLNS